MDRPDLATWARRLVLGAGRWFAALYGFRTAPDWGGLGPRILRTETAGLCAMSALFCLYGDME